MELQRQAVLTTELAERVAHFEALVREPRGFPARLAQDPALEQALDDLRYSISVLMAEIARNPLMFFF
jgi:hypothetical protein